MALFGGKQKVGSWNHKNRTSRQIKLFQDYTFEYEKFESKVNDWLNSKAGEIDVIDIQYTSCPKSDRGEWLIWTVMVVYVYKTESGVEKTE